MRLCERYHPEKAVAGRRRGHTRIVRENPAPDGIFQADNTGRYLEVNRAACKLTGYPVHELLQKHILDLIPVEGTALAAEHFSQVKRLRRATGDIGSEKRAESAGSGQYQR